MKRTHVKLLNLFLVGLLMFSIGFLIGGLTESKQYRVAVVKPIKPLTVQVEPKQVASEKLYIGEFVITGYCPCAKCCGKAGQDTASGTKPTAGRTVGADWSVLPAGTEIFIEGLGYRTVEDKPADWIIDRYNGKIIDVFCNTHEEAKKIGRQVVKVYKSDK